MTGWLWKFSRDGGFPNSTKIGWNPIATVKWDWVSNRINRAMRAPFRIIWRLMLVLTAATLLGILCRNSETKDISPPASSSYAELLHLLSSPFFPDALPSLWRSQFDRNWHTPSQKEETVHSLQAHKLTDTHTTTKTSLSSLSSPSLYLSPSVDASIFQHTQNHNGCSLFLCSWLCLDSWFGMQLVH